ncbi:MAG TPA: polysaccharide biosynthesis C-terminal domain-containing protein [Solirubrobacteraceae bacterium]
MNTSDTNASTGDTAPSAKHGSYRSGFAFGILSFVAVAGVTLVSTVATSRIYGIRIIGQFALVSAPVAALWVLSTAKEQAALIKEITQLPTRHPRVTQLFSAVFTFSSTLTIVMSALGALVSWWVFRGPLHHPDLVTPTFVSLAGYALVTNTAWNVDSIFSAFVAGRQLFWVRLHEAVSFFVIAVAIGLGWRTIWGLVIATIGSSVTGLIHRVIAVRPFVRLRLSLAEYRVGLRELPGLLRFGLKITPGSIAQGVSQQAGVWAIGAIAPVTVVGAYSRALTIPQRLQQVNVRIVEVLYPTLVGRRAKGDGHGFDRALIDSVRYGLVGMLLFAAVLGGAAHSLLLIFGPGFSDAAPALVLLLLFPALTSMTATQTQALWAIGRPGLTSFISFARLAVTIGLTVALTPRMGVTGPALALIVGYLVVVVWNTVSIHPTLARPIHATWPLREQLALVVAYATGYAGANVVEHAVPSTPGLLLALLAGTLTYAAAFLVLGGLNERDRHRIGGAAVQARAWRERRKGSQDNAAVHGSPDVADRPDGSATSHAGREGVNHLQIEVEAVE